MSAPAGATRTEALPWTGVAWIAWAWAMVLVLPGFMSLPVAGAAVAAVGATWWLHPRARSASPATSITTGLVLAAVWMALGVLIQRPAAGGQVLWVLTEFSPASGTPLGGPVTTGQMLLAAEYACTAFALCLAGGLMLAVLRTDEWDATMRLLLGRGADAVRPVLTFADERGRDAGRRRARRSHGLPTGERDWSASWATATRRARAWTSVVAAGGARRRDLLRIPVGLGALGVATVGAATRWSGAGVLAFGLVLAALLVLGLLLWDGRFTGPDLLTFPPALGAVALIGAWHWGGFEDVTLLACAVLLLPAATLFVWEKR